MSPSSNVSRTQPTYTQNQILPEQPKIQHQEEPTNHNVDVKENQEPIKKDIPITEGIIFYFQSKLKFYNKFIKSKNCF